MKTKTITVLCLMVSGLMPAFAQNPTTSASTVPDAPRVPDAPLAPSAPTLSSTSSLLANQVVYTAQLPTVQEMTDAAAAKGSAITRVEQTESEILTAYRFANGQESVVAYRLLPSAGTTSSAPVRVVTPAPPTTVYVPSPRVVYYDSYRSYDPWFWYPTVALGIGLGIHHGIHHHWRHGGGYRYNGYRHGGYHHGGFRHGGYHRGGFLHRGHHRHR